MNASIHRLDGGQTAQELADSLSPGEIGILPPGIYDGFWLSKPDIAIRAEVALETTIRGRIRFTREATRAKIKGLRCDGTGFDLSPLIYADGAAVLDCEITNSNETIGLHVQRYGSDRPPRNVLVARCRIHHCGAANNQDHGVYIGVADTVLVRDCLIYDNGARGVQIHGSNCRVARNVIDGNAEGVLFGTSDTPGSAPASDNLVFGNVIANSKVRRNVEAFWPGAAGTGNLVRNNLLWYPQGGYYGGDPANSGIGDQVGFVAYDNVVADPQFGDRVDFQTPTGYGPRRSRRA